MAILSSPLEDRVRPRLRRKRRVNARSTRAVVGQWLAQPLASYYLVLVVSVLLLGMGILMVWSASSVLGQVNWADPYYYVKRQLLFLAVGLPIAWWLSTVSPRMLKIIGWIAVLGSLALLAATFVHGVGIEVNGNRNWLQLGGSLFRIQPSEFAKLSLVIWGADVLARKGKLLAQPKHLLIPFLPVSLLMIGLVLLQGDLGTSMVMGAMVLAVLYVAGANWRVILILVLGAAAGVAVMALSRGNRVMRIIGFLNPDSDPMGVNLQPARGIYALASGGWLGLGLGYSRQKWGLLSQAHTDYILAIIGEELGLVGVLLVILLFFALAYAGIRIATRSEGPFQRVAAAGITAWLVVQALLNIMVVLRLFPVLGVPLPFLSYGGSALMANVLAVGVLLALARQEPDARRVLSHRLGTERVRISAVVQGRRS